jgi:2-dehydropantoate 2-reductase
MRAAPHVVIAGAGTIGCYIGGRLIGHARVTLVGRPRTAAIVSQHGLALSDWQGYQRRIEPEALTFGTDIRAVGAADLVLVTVKSVDTLEIARKLADALTRPTLVVSFQNGLRNSEVLRQHLGKHKVLAGMVPFNVVQRAPGALHQGSSGAMMVQADIGLAPFLSIFRASGLALQQRKDIRAVQQAKLLLNLNNAINALSDLPLLDELSQRAWRRCLAMAQQEALRVVASAGMRPARLTALPARWLPTVLNLPDRWFRLVAPRLLAIDPQARSSMWEDLQTGRRTEVDAIQGEVIALAAANGGSAPVNERLLTLIREAETQRVRLSGKQLLTLL